ncbi:MAG: zinc-binding dehydrogenase [Leptospirales bacterium]|nr:zinc-binding dehydrogenase [Leptospirales bacterium]
MKAALLYKGERKLRIEDIAPRSPGPGQVRVQVKACGVCGSDVHLVLHQTMNASSYPRIPGHESSGIVLETGEGANRFKAGQRVVIAAGTSCGSCKACLAGRYNLCAQVGVLGFDADGAYAEEVVVPETSLVPFPDSLPFAQAAILADAVSTPYHALKYAGALQAGETAAIFGCGGLGIHGVLIARALEARVIALDVDAGALQNARDAGAHETIDLNSKINAGKILKQMGGVDVIADFSGYYKNIEDCVRSMNSGGRMVMVGIGRGQLHIGVPASLTFKMIQICGSYGSDARALPELIHLVERGQLDLSRSITALHPLEDAQLCLEHLEGKVGNPIRFVLQPSA